MIDVPQPTRAESALHAKPWNGAAHHDRCVEMVDGTVIVGTTYPSYAVFETWGSERTTFLSTPDHYGRIVIVSQGGPPFTGRVCLGIGEPGPARR
ncbi:MAG: hypothetical protein NVSMB19_23180 [Vulcanimicrobiaceae bacterium]